MAVPNRSWALRMVLIRTALVVFLTVFLFACGGSDSVPTSNSTDITEAESQRLYTMKCGLCHGNDGKLMLSGAPDLSSSRLELNERIALITYGKGKMPPQKDVLTADEIRGIARYIETFRK